MAMAFWHTIDKPEFHFHDGNEIDIPITVSFSNFGPYSVLIIGNMAVHGGKDKLKEYKLALGASVIVIGNNITIYSKEGPSFGTYDIGASLVVDADFKNG